ncbi:hypothetical protein [Empedobacter falsenii]
MVNKNWQIIDAIENFAWDDWKAFPDPRKKKYLIAPFGFGVYQLRNTATKEYILFGKGKHLAYRMSTILPPPYGCGTRNNESKRVYVLENLNNIEYRTVSFASDDEMKQCEDEIKFHKIHKFNS